MNNVTINSISNAGVEEYYNISLLININWLFRSKKSQSPKVFFSLLHSVVANQIINENKFN